jgi:peptidoglycan hydrolase CwlO-like protein
MNTIQKTLTMICAIGLAGTVMATPNGKPFVEIDNQIVEVQGQVNSLQDQMAALVATVDDIALRTAANEGAIATLEASNLDLQAQIDASTGDVAALSAEVANNTTLIGMLNDEIAVINALLADAQQIEAGICPDGQILQFQDANRTVCQPNNWPSEAGTIINSTLRIAPGRTASFNIGCVYETAPVKRAQNLTISQNGDVHTLRINNYGNRFVASLQNRSNMWQTVNASILCTAVN